MKLFCSNRDVAGDAGIAVEDVLPGCVVDENRYGAIDEHAASIEGIVLHLGFSTSFRSFST